MPAVCFVYETRELHQVDEGGCEAHEAESVEEAGESGVGGFHPLEGMLCHECGRHGECWRFWSMEEIIGPVGNSKGNMSIQ